MKCDHCGRKIPIGGQTCQSPDGHKIKMSCSYKGIYNKWGTKKKTRKTREELIIENKELKEKLEDLQDHIQELVNQF